MARSSARKRAATLGQRLREITEQNDANALLAGRKPPWNWTRMSKSEQLDHIADRIIAEDREGLTKWSDLGEHGILSEKQMDRRRNREVSSESTEFGGIDNDRMPLNPGVFSRVYVKPDDRPGHTLDHSRPLDGSRVAGARQKENILASIQRRKEAAERRRRGG